MVRRIWKALRFKAEGGAPSVCLTAFSDASIKEVASIKLYARLIGYDFKHPSVRRIVNFRRYGAVIEHKIVIVAVALLQLLVVVINARSDRGRFAEIEGCPLNLRQFAGRNRGFIGRSIAAGIDLQFVFENVAIPCTSEIEVGMIR